MQRRTSEQTRALLIETGMQMLLERGATAGVSHIRLQQVLRRAGLTTGAAYRLWPDQDAYQHDLAVHATTWRDDSPTATTMARIAELIERGEPLAEVVRQGTAAHVEGFEKRDGRRQPTFLLALALRATAAHSDELRLASRRRHQQSLDEFADLYQRVMDRYGRRLRPGRSIQQLAEAMAAVGEGFALHAIEGIEHPRILVAGADGGTAEWTLYGLTIWSLIQTFTDDLPAVDDEAAGR